MSEPAQRAGREPQDSLEGWAYAYVTSCSLAYKLAPPPLPRELASRAASPVRLAAPGRPPELAVSWKKYKAPKSAEALRHPHRRAHLLHTFFHHELQAAELMCWAALAFPETPCEFRRGLLRICLDEARHMRMYAEQLATLDFAPGAFAVRDWFWQRAPAARSASEFLALMGLGFEAGNLDHSQRFVALFQQAGDAQAAALQAAVSQDERAHVAFAARWFRSFAGPLEFERWRRALPAPLSPVLMRGKPLAREARRAAGFDDTFLDRLETWSPASPGC